MYHLSNYQTKVTKILFKIMKNEKESVCEQFVDENSMFLMQSANSGHGVMDICLRLKFCKK